MHTLPRRRHVPHWEFPGGAVCLTWRLHRSQLALRTPERDLVLEVIARSQPMQCSLIAAVVMDDHCHALTLPAAGVTAKRLAQTWKSVSAHELVAQTGRSAPVWQAEYFDRWMRSEEHRAACAEYILDNPRRRWPGVSAYPWHIRGY